jgi:hypothetical protein
MMCHGNFEMLKVAFGEQMLGKKIFEWFSTFRSCVTYAEDAECSECPPLDKTDKAWFE